MTKFKIAVLVPLVALAMSGGSRAMAACYEQLVRVSCPTGQISPALIPTTTATSTAYVPWSAVEGTGTATSTSSGTLVHAADPRLSDARSPTTHTHTVTDVGGAASTAWVTSVLTGYATMAYTTATQIDFTTEANQTITASGTATIGGVAAYANNVATYSQTFKVINGSGLYIRASTTSSNDSGSTYTSPSVSWPLSSFSSMLPWWVNDVWVLVKATYSNAPAANYDRTQVGVAYNSSSAGSVVGASWRIRQIDIYNSSYSGNYCQNVGMITAPAGSDVYARSAACGSIAATYDIAAFHVKGNHEVVAFAGQSVDGSFPAITALTYLYTVEIGAVTISGGVQTVEFPSIFVGTASQNTNGNADILVTKMLVMYR